MAVVSTLRATEFTEINEHNLAEHLTSLDVEDGQHIQDILDVNDPVLVSVIWDFARAAIHIGFGQGTNFVTHDPKAR